MTLSFSVYFLKAIETHTGSDLTPKHLTRFLCF